MNYKEIKVGEIFSSNNYGDFVIIKESNKRRYREKCYDIQFLKTNSIRYGICRKEILRGEVKDYYYPSIAGVEYLGEGILQKNYKREYSIWKHMLHRCYNKDNDSYCFYGEKGVTVCERWHCFKNFVEDIKYIEGYDEALFKSDKLELDKDLKCEDFPKEYNIENCIFLSKNENIKIKNEQRKNRRFKDLEKCMNNKFVQ